MVLKDKKSYCGRQENTIEKTIGDYEIIVKRWSNADFIEFIEHPKYDFGIILADTPGHSKKIGKQINKTLMTNQWYLEEDAFTSLNILSKKLDKKRKQKRSKQAREKFGRKKAGKTNALESLSISYSLFHAKENEDYINYIRSGLPPEMILTNEEVKSFEKGGIPPIAFIQDSHKELEENFKLQKGDQIFLYTDGLIENPYFLELISIETKNIPHREEGEVYYKTTKELMKKRLKEILLENKEKSPKATMNQIIEKLGKYFIPTKEEPHDDVTIAIIKKIS